MRSDVFDLELADYSDLPTWDCTIHAGDLEFSLAELGGIGGPEGRSA